MKMMVGYSNFTRVEALCIDAGKAICSDPGEALCIHTGENVGLLLLQDAGHDGRPLRPLA